MGGISMKKIHHNQREYQLIKSKEFPCHTCILQCYTGMVCPVPQGYIVKKVIQTLPQDMEKTIWEIMNCYHIACIWAPVLNQPMNLIRSSVHYLINHGTYDVAVYSYNVFKTSDFYKELKKRKLV